MASEPLNTIVTYVFFGLVIVLMIGGMVIFWPFTVAIGLIYLFTHGPLRRKTDWERQAEEQEKAKRPVSQIKGNEFPKPNYRAAGIGICVLVVIGFAMHLANRGDGRSHGVVTSQPLDPNKTYVAPVWVDPYSRNGSQVPGHFRTSPDDTKANNYSTKGNVNPFTGQRGSQ